MSTRLIALCGVTPNLNVDIASLPILTLRRAVAYTGFSVSTLRRAVRNGKLKRYGVVGEKGTWTFRRAELDRWLRGQQ